MSSSSPMEVVIDNTESPDATRDTTPTNRSEHSHRAEEPPSTHPHTDSSTPMAEPLSREPLDELFRLPYMQRADDKDLSDLCDKAAEQGLKGYGSDPAAAAVHLTLVKVLPPRPEELEVLFEELYPAVRDSKRGLQLLERLDKGLEVKCSSSWEYMSGGRLRKAWMVATDVDVAEEVASQISAPGHRLNVAHESIRHHYDVRFHRLQWGFSERVPISFLVEDHIVGRQIEIERSHIAEGRRTHAGSLIAQLRRDRPELAGPLVHGMIQTARGILELDRQSEADVLSRLRERATGEVRRIIDKMGWASLRFLAVTALQLAEQVSQDDQAPASPTGSGHSDAAVSSGGFDEPSGPAHDGNDGSEGGTKPPQTAASTSPEAGQAGEAASDRRLHASLAEIYLCLQKREWLGDKHLMALARFRMQRAGSDTCRTAFLDELVIDETRTRTGGTMAMPEDKMQRFKEARVRGMFVADRFHWSVIVQGRDGKTAYLDTKEEHRTMRQASAQSWYRWYLNLSGVMPAGEEEVDWVDCDVPTQSDGWECALVAVELWMRSVTGKSSPTRTVERWDLGQLVSELQSDISRELGQRIIDAAVWLDKSRFNDSDVLVRVCEAGKHPDGLETGVGEVVAEVEKVMGEDQANVNPQQRRRCCRLLVALAALDNEHCIRGELAEKAAQSEHWVGVEIDRIARGETYNFDDLESFKVGGSAA